MDRSLVQVNKSRLRSLSMRATVPKQTETAAPWSGPVWFVLNPLTTTGGFLDRRGAGLRGTGMHGTGMHGTGLRGTGMHGVGTRLHRTVPTWHGSVTSDRALPARIGSRPEPASHRRTA